MPRRCAAPPLVPLSAFAARKLGAISTAPAPHPRRDSPLMRLQRFRQWRGRARLGIDPPGLSGAPCWRARSFNQGLAGDWVSSIRRSNGTADGAAQIERADFRLLSQIVEGRALALGTSDIAEAAAATLAALHAAPGLALHLLCGRIGPDPVRLNQVQRAYMLGELYRGWVQKELPSERGQRWADCWTVFHDSGFRVDMDDIGLSSADVSALGDVEPTNFACPIGTAKTKAKKPQGASGKIICKRDVPASASAPGRQCCQSQALALVPSGARVTAAMAEAEAAAKPPQGFVKGGGWRLYRGVLLDQYEALRSAGHGYESALTVLHKGWGYGKAPDKNGGSLGSVLTDARKARRAELKGPVSFVHRLAR